MTKEKRNTIEKGYSLNKWCWENWTTTCERMKLVYCLKTAKKLMQNHLKILRPEPIQLLGENTGSMLFDFHLSNILLNVS